MATSVFGFMGALVDCVFAAENYAAYLCYAQDPHFTSPSAMVRNGDRLLCLSGYLSSFQQTHGRTQRVANTEHHYIYAVVRTNYWCAGYR